MKKRKDTLRYSSVSLYFLSQDKDDFSSENLLPADGIIIRIVIKKKNIIFFLVTSYLKLTASFKIFIVSTIIISLDSPAKRVCPSALRANSNSSIQNSHVYSTIWIQRVSRFFILLSKINPDCATIRPSFGQRNTRWIPLPLPAYLCNQC